MSDSARPWLEVVVKCRREECADVITLELADPKGRDLPPFSAGSHIEIEIAPQLIRQYSLCNHPAQRDRYEIAVLRERQSRGGSAALHRDARPGKAFRISAPRNNFLLAGHSGPAVLLGAGIGITPLLCMAERLASIGAPFRMHYAVRNLDRAAFHGRLLGSSFADRVTFHVSGGDGGRRIDFAEVLAAPAPDAQLYVCGPPSFIDAALAQAPLQGWRDDQLHREYFIAPETQAEHGEERAFEVQIASSGTVLHIPADRSVAEVLDEAGFEIPVSCSQGICGTCLTRVIHGEVDHRDFYLSDDEHATNDQFTPCCSRAVSSRLVLDL